MILELTQGQQINVVTCTMVRRPEFSDQFQWYDINEWGIRPPSNKDDLSQMISHFLLWNTLQHLPGGAFLVREEETEWICPLPTVSFDWSWIVLSWNPLLYLINPDVLSLIIRAQNQGYWVPVPVLLRSLTVGQYESTLPDAQELERS